MKIRERLRIFYEITEKCADARGFWRFHDFLHIFVGGTPRKMLQFHEIVKIRDRRRIFEPESCQFF